MEKQKGIFIVLEGIDGSGKSTEAKLLAEYYIQKGHSVFLTSEPSKSKFGMMFRENLKSKEYSNLIDAYLISIDRILHCQEIQSALDQGKIVISDRYLDSTIAYQLLDYGKNAVKLDYKFLKTLNKYCIIPNIVIILNISPELAFERIQKNRTDFEKFDSLQYLKALNANYGTYNVFAKTTIYSYIPIYKELSAEDLLNKIVQLLGWEFNLF